MRCFGTRWHVFFSGENWVKDPFKVPFFEVADEIISDATFMIYMIYHDLLPDEILQAFQIVQGPNEGP